MASDYSRSILISLIPSYNKKYKTNCKTLADMLTDCYGNRAKCSMYRMVPILGVSYQVIVAFMREEGVKYYPKGGNPKKRARYWDRFQALNDHDRETTPAEDIAKKLGCCMTTIYRYRRMHGKYATNYKG